MKSIEKVCPFGDYFSDENFKRMLDKVLFEPENNALGKTTTSI